MMRSKVIPFGKLKDGTPVKIYRLQGVGGLILVHFSYGMVELPEGKMKSREGTVVDAGFFLALFFLVGSDFIYGTSL